MLDLSKPPIQIGGFWFFIAILANASEDKAFVVSDSTDDLSSIPAAVTN
jgi:hypothetical protein